MLINRQQHRYNLIFLALLSTLCFWLAWPPKYLFTPLLLVAFVPLLYIKKYTQQHIKRKPAWHFYKYVYCTLFLWNLTTTWWVAHATVAGTAFMLLVNTFCMSLPLLLTYWTTRYFGQLIGDVACIVYWVSMEYIHMQWEFSFPWLNLGNGLACWPEWVQWYEYTGALGGTVWVIVANLFIFYLLTNQHTVQRRRVLGGILGCWILLPTCYSYYMYGRYHEQGKAVEIVAMQPNINPYTGVWEATGEAPVPQDCVERFIQLSGTQCSNKTQFLIWPEGAIDSLLNEKILSTYPIIDQLIRFQQSHPQLSLLTGLNSLVGYGDKKATKTARFKHRHGYYDIFNTALFIGDQGELATYHKSKLVPGIELVPYLYSLKVPAVLVPNGYNELRSLGIQEKPRVFFNKEGVGVAPIICYESIYGTYVAAFVRMGATLIFAITIDGWWKHTPGYQQHFHYTRLRAIESRRSIARAALKGISAFINQRGDILQAVQYEDQAAMKHTLQANTIHTFYVRHGDYIAHVALWLSCILLLGVVLRRLFTKGRQEEHADLTT